MQSHLVPVETAYEAHLLRSAIDWLFRPRLLHSLPSLPPLKLQLHTRPTTSRYTPQESWESRCAPCCHTSPLARAPMPRSKLACIVQKLRKSMPLGRLNIFATFLRCRSTFRLSVGVLFRVANNKSSALRCFDAAQIPLTAPLRIPCSSKGISRLPCNVFGSARSPSYNRSSITIRFSRILFQRSASASPMRIDPKTMRVTMAFVGSGRCSSTA